MISRNDLINVLSRNDSELTAADAADFILSQIDKNNDGQIDLTEFLSTLIVDCKQDTEIVEYMVHYISK